jgi:hypothetical protein
VNGFGFLAAGFVLVGNAAFVFERGLVRNPKGSTGAVGDADCGGKFFSFDVDRGTAFPAAAGRVAKTELLDASEVGASVVRFGASCWSSGATAAVRTASVGKVPLEARSGLTCRSAGKSLGLTSGEASLVPASGASGAVRGGPATTVSSDAGSLTERSTWAIANTPSTNTVANAKISKTMRFMGTYPVERTRRSCRRSRPAFRHSGGVSTKIRQAWEGHFPSSASHSRDI